MGALISYDHEVRTMNSGGNPVSHLVMRLTAILLCLLLSVAVSPQAIAEETPAGPNTQQQLFGEGELDALVAPIALYPDALLAQVLMASTYPLEIVQADRWAKANKSLKGEAIKNALIK